jgi:osmoprotectant transport system permease protein
VTLAPAPARATGQGGRRFAWVRNRVLFVLVLAALGAAVGLAFVSVAPNRLLSGTGVALSGLLVGWRLALLGPALVLGAAVFMPSARATHAAVALAATLLLAGWVALAGDEATRLSAGGSGIARVSLGGGFWILVLLTWLAAADALQRLKLGAVGSALAHAGVLSPVLALLMSGALDPLSLLKEYANRQDVFQAAGWRHAQIVLATLLPALLLGVPLGIAAARRERFARPLFALLNVIQTVPSIALFGLLIAPLAWLGAALPASGIRGIGLWPAVVALTLYALLPIVHGMASGLKQVPAGALAAAIGMGLTPRQVFWKVELPLALPVLLSGLRVTTVQVVGLAVVAALIGAGGFGALMFQGLFSSALDLVLLGALPVVALAIVVDAGFQLLGRALHGPGG